MNKNLMSSIKFWPLFWTQATGALNDNLFKNALIILITFKAKSILGLGVDQMVALTGGIFILPFFLFSAISGEISDKMAKDKLIVFTKYLEVAIMIMGAAGFFMQSIWLLLISLFLLGLQSTIFGPAKYSVLPELLPEESLVKGNALVEMGTFLAILIGTIAGGILIGMKQGEFIISAVGILISLLGLWFSKKMEPLRPVAPDLKVNINVFKSTWDVVNLSRKTHSVFISILGISWFWYLGATLLTIFPIYVKDTLNGSESIVTLFLAIFSVGVAVGSIICEKMSHEKVEVGLVPFGSMGICVFLFHLWYLGRPYAETSQVLGIGEFLSQTGSFWILFDLAGLSVMSGFFIVPLYTFIQSRSAREERSRIIAANNILNACFMVLASVVLMILFSFKLSPVDVILSLFILNLLVSAYIYTVIPEFLWRLFCVVMGRALYRFRISGLHHIPKDGPAVIVSNHVSFVDWLILSASVPRPMRFVMHYSFAEVWFLKPFVRGAKVIPIAGSRENPVLLDKAFEDIARALEEGELVCIFPEGMITLDGKLNKFRPGIERIIKRNSVPVVPIVISGLWGSFFSRKYGPAATNFKIIPSKIWSIIGLSVGSPWEPQKVEAQELENYYRSALGESSLRDE
jgi:1-acyl-sn-glycerol-3-phosphate acyltransferase